MTVTLRTGFVLAAFAIVAFACSVGSTQALADESFSPKIEGRPELSGSGESLNWQGEDPTGAYLVKRTVAGGEPEYAVVKALQARPPFVANQTVGYRVKGVLERNWSPEVSIEYGLLPAENLAPGALSESSFFERNEGRPGLNAAGEVLTWSEAEPSGAYLLKRNVPGQETEFEFVEGLRARPPAIPGSSVRYRVKGVLATYFSPEAAIAYPSPEGGETTEEEATSVGATVNRSPAGPAPPEGGWHVAFADAFGAPLGTEPGDDNFVYPNQNGCCNPSVDYHGNNTNELQVYNGSQVRVGAEGLELIDRYAPKRAPAQGSYPVRNYVSGSISTQPQYQAGGYRSFSWKPGGGQTWAFECYCKLPANSPFSGVDPGWWSTDPKWTDEIDFFEEWGWNPTCQTSLLTSCFTGIAWVYDTSPLQVRESYRALYGMFDPSDGFHRYTTVINPNNTWSEYIDGQLQRWVGNNGVGPAPPYFERVQMSLLLTNALRDKMGASGPNPYPGFSSGSRTFTIRSIAVYQDGAHAGQSIAGGGVAPGTTLK
jgi:hypothetical protein